MKITPTIILKPEVADKELLSELRAALIKKGFADDKHWNDSNEDMDWLTIWEDNELIMLSYVCGPNETIPVSRDDFQTMFLLY